MKPQNRPIVAILVGSLVLAFVVVLGAGQRGDSTPADDAAIAVVDGMEVTWADWRFLQASDEAVRIFQDGVVGGGLDLPEPFAGREASLEETYRLWRALRDGYRAEVVVAGGVVLDAAVLAAAAEAGALPSDEEVAEQASLSREMAEDSQDWEQSPGLALVRLNHDAGVEAFGEEAYWSETVPRRLRLSLATERLLRDAGRALVDWSSLQYELALAADVRWLDAAPGPIDVDEVRGYLAEMRDFISEHQID